MRIPFTKMHGAGNDFVVLDETRGRLGLQPAHYRWLADRHLGVGADQILSVRPSPAPGLDFEYIIHNADGGEVEQCGNGARCFARYVADAGLTQQAQIRVRTRASDITLVLEPDGRVTVNMGVPVFDLARVPFDPMGVCALPTAAWQTWPLAGLQGPGAVPVRVSVVSMGNPHAQLWLDAMDDAALDALVADLGPRIAHHPSFPNRVNAAFAQRLDAATLRLRVFERGTGETLACGSGACAAVVAGRRLGWLAPQVEVHMRGGRLGVAWAGGDAPVFMTGPAQRVFAAEVDVPDFS